MTKVKKDILIVVGLFIIGFVTYFPMLNGPFFFDDEHFILKNTLVHALSNLFKIYVSSVTDGAHIAGNFYRPNQQAVYAVLYSLYKDSTSIPYHLVSLVLHSLNSCLLFFWLRALNLSRMAAVAGALLFLVHPVQAEAVCYISGLADPLSLFFVLIVLNLVTNLDSKIKILCTVVSTMLALLSKENAVILAPFMALWFLYRSISLKKFPTRREIIVTILVSILCLASALLKFTVFKFSDGSGLTTQVNAYTENLWLRITTFISILPEYASLLVWPAHLFYEKPYTAYPSLFTVQGGVGLSIVLMFLVSLIFAKKSPRLALGSSMSAVALLPFSGIIPLNAMYLEHWLYSVMIGLSLIVALMLDALMSKSKYFSYLFLSILLSLSVRSHARSKEWADIEKFYLNEVAHSGNSGRIYNNLGMYYADKGLSQKALEYYLLASEGDTGKLFPQPHHNLAIAYFNAGKPDAALASIKRALSLDPNFIYSLRLLRDYYGAMNDAVKQRAVDEFIIRAENGEKLMFEELQGRLF